MSESSFICVVWYGSLPVTNYYQLTLEIRFPCNRFFIICDVHIIGLVIRFRFGIINQFWPTYEYHVSPLHEQLQPSVVRRCLPLHPGLCRATNPSSLCSMYDPNIRLYIRPVYCARSRFLLAFSGLSNGEQRCLIFPLKEIAFTFIRKRSFLAWNAVSFLVRRRNSAQSGILFVYLSILKHLFIQHTFVNHPVILYLARRNFRIVGTPPVPKNHRHTYTRSAFYQSLGMSESESESESLYDWRLTANQFILASSPLRPTTSIFSTYSYSPIVTSVSDERMGPSFTIAVGPRQRSHSRAWVPRDSWPYFTLSDSRLPQPEGPGPYIYIPHE
jgi:hypothetical protein